MVACSEDSISVKCEKKCTETLPCGHPCKGTCYTCFQGTLHQSCQEKCKKTYICGHLCTKKCSEPCGICDKKCEYKCCEAKCDRKCGEPCYECKNKCRLGCRHVKCKNLCSEICDRSPCNFPCNVEFKCGHECMGLCGEKCLPVCRLCEPDHEIFQIFFGEEDDPEARFYGLECEHFFEVKALDKYMGYGKEESKQQEANRAVQFQVCPICKKTICKSNRYQAQIKKTFEHISNVKKKLVKENTVELEKLKELSTEAEKLLLENSGEKSKFWKRICEAIEKEFKTAKRKNSNVLRQTFYNYYYPIKFYTEYNANFQYAEAHRTENSFDALSYYLQLKHLGSFYLLNEQVDINDQQWELVQAKLTSLSLFRHLKTLSLTSPQNRQYVNPYINEIVKNKFWLDPLKIQECNKILQKFSITREEQVQVIKALNLGAGHIYTCPNGHYYVIGECGGAMEVSRCPECKSQIGGTEHNLIAGNRHSGDLDGSQYAAFSNEANMNIGFGNFN